MDRLFQGQECIGLSHALTPPADHPRLSESSIRSARQQLLYPQSTCEALRRLAYEEKVPPGVPLLAAFMALLVRYTQQPEVAIGTPRINGHRAEAEDLQTDEELLFVHADLSDDPEFRSLMSRVQRALYDAESRERGSRAGRSPSSRVIFAFQESSIASSLFEPGDVLGPAPISTEWDLVLTIFETANELKGALIYRDSLFEASMVERLVGHLRNLLTGAVENPDTPVSRLPLLTEEERQLMLVSWNRTAVTFPQNRSIHELFEEEAERAPEAIAFILQDQRLSYGELNRRANQLARHLRRAGVGSEVLVGLCLERSFEMIIAVLAVLKAGGAYVALDPAGPRLRLLDILHDASPTVLLTQRHLDCFENCYSGPRVYLNELAPQLALEATTNLPKLARPDNLLNIVYTSASTGKPKGVLIPISAVLNRLHWMWREYPFQADDAVVFHKSYALVAAAWEFFGGLLRGVPTLILSPEEVLDPAHFWRRVVDHRVTYLLATPPLLRSVLDQGERHPGQWKTLRLATTSAEPIPPSLVERWYRVFPDVPLLNLYGSTECSSNVTAYDTRRLPSESTRVPIGRPFDNNQVYILDRQLQPMPIGVIGEMCVSGACLARGYLNLPERTAAQFIPSPFSSGNTTLYRTGDLARYLSDGTIELVGRVDNQVKIRGFRVELEDVEASILQHEAIKSCAVILHSDVVAGPCLAAYFIAEGEISTSELRRFLQERLPAPMVPASFTRLEALPLTPGGKLDRRRLPPPSGSRSMSSARQTEPRNRLEKMIGRLLEEILEVEGIGVNESFLDLGLHSLLIARVHGELQRRLQRDFPIIAMLQHASIASLARYLSDGSEQSTTALDEGQTRAQKRLALRGRPGRHRL